MLDDLLYQRKYTIAYNVNDTILHFQFARKSTIAQYRNVTSLCREYTFKSVTSLKKTRLSYKLLMMSVRARKKIKRRFKLNVFPVYSLNIYVESTTSLNIDQND